MNLIDWLFALTGLMGGFGLGMFYSRTLLARTRVEITSLEKQLASSSAYATALREQQQSADKAQAQLKLEFENVATKIFENISSKFSVQSEKKMVDILNPLRERLGEFQKLVTDSFTTQGKEQHTLKAEIEKIVLQTDSLTKALRGDVKAQGNWGEVMLEKILEESGLRPGQDYIIQAADLGLSGAEGNRLRPDVIVNLPDNKHIIVDSKVSLTAYDRYCASTDDAARALCLADFLRSIKAHVNGLEQKRYQDIDKLGTPDFVVLFLPIEGAYSLAVQHDPELHSYAWNKHIVLTNPANLFAILRTVQNLWRIEQQNRNSQKIAEQGGKLYDKLVGFCEDMLAVGKQMDNAQKTYDRAMGKLKDDRGNLIGSAEKLKALGIKTSKGMPLELLTDEETEAEDIRQLAATS